MGHCDECGGDRSQAEKVCVAAVWMFQVAAPPKPWSDEMASLYDATMQWWQDNAIEIPADPG